MAISHSNESERSISELLNDKSSYLSIALDNDLIDIIEKKIIEIEHVNLAIQKNLLEKKEEELEIQRATGQKNKNDELQEQSDAIAKKTKQIADADAKYYEERKKSEEQRKSEEIETLRALVFDLDEKIRDKLVPQYEKQQEECQTEQNNAIEEFVTTLVRQDVIKENQREELSVSLKKIPTADEVLSRKDNITIADDLKVNDEKSINAVTDTITKGQASAFTETVLLTLNKSNPTKNNFLESYKTHRQKLDAAQKNVFDRLNPVNKKMLSTTLLIAEAMRMRESLDQRLRDLENPRQFSLR